MDKLRKIGIWYYLLNKRLFTRAGFLIILFLIPLCVFSLNLISQEDNGIVTVALSCEDNNDVAAKKIITELTERKSVIRFLTDLTPDEAETAVISGKADGAWIFPEELDEKINKFIKQNSSQNAFITIIEREETIPLQFAREKLYGALYSTCSPKIYRDYIGTNVKNLSKLSDAELSEYYERTKTDGDIFKFSYADKNENTSDATSSNYITAPLRGLLAITVVLAGLAIAIYYLQDEKNGTFELIPYSRRTAFSVCYSLTAITDVAAVMLVSLFFAKINVGITREIIMMILYILCVSGFCLIIRQIFNSAMRLATITPIIIIGMITICPIFFNTGFLRPILLLLPPYYYLSAVHNVRYLYLMVLYAVLSHGIYFAIRRVSRKLR